VDAIRADEATTVGEPLLAQRVDEGDRGGLRCRADDITVVADAGRDSGVRPRGSDDDKAGVRSLVPDRGIDFSHSHVNLVTNLRGVEPAAEQHDQMDVCHVHSGHEVRQVWSPSVVTYPASPVAAISTSMSGMRCSSGAGQPASPCPLRGL